MALCRAGHDALAEVLFLTTTQAMGIRHWAPGGRRRDTLAEILFRSAPRKWPIGIRCGGFGFAGLSCGFQEF